ncbi:diacylglycerol/lipid kinase family protein [Cellulomonas palmilytica]|uniref:diacylglycerol/lipid kinase family protein n=1 Tax=Cellulomonas palmilytica TaxID=2608402 RepID=UPI001F1664A7|nr:diacylglycerol kinase family protein [Cellulomonas palmilytica]UJP40771.1 NAD(+)/NADH kinase [Cellulomonas palmilytica]
MRWEAWTALAAGVLAVVALVVAAVVALRQRDLLRRLDAEDPATSPRARALTRQVRARGQQLAFVANPTKPDVPALREAIENAAAEQGLPRPLWLETTIEDPGTGQAREAVERGADVVVAVGGDGTVRGVAAALVGTGVPMGLLPLGTGNLLARNLDIPIGSPLSALEAVVTGRDRTIDVGWLRVESAAKDPDDHAHAHDGDEHLFLVIAGLGFDAAMVADADDGLKARVGWIAYFLAGIKHLHGRRTRVHLRIDDRPATSARLRSLLIGNCGRLPGGITLLPDAVVDDGWLDIAAIDTRGGVAGWAQLFGEVVLQGVGVKGMPRGIGRIDHTRARAVRVAVSGAEHAQVDGEVVGRVSEVSARIDPEALVVRVAA